MYLLELVTMASQDFHESMACNIDIFCPFLEIFSLERHFVLVRKGASHVLGPVFGVIILELAGQGGHFPHSFITDCHCYRYDCIPFIFTSLRKIERSSTHFLL